MFAGLWIHHKPLKKIKEERSIFSQGNVTVLQKMTNEKARVKLTNTQLNKLKFTGNKRLEQY